MSLKCEPQNRFDEASHIANAVPIHVARIKWLFSCYLFEHQKTPREENILNFVATLNGETVMDADWDTKGFGYADTGRCGRSNAFRYALNEALQKEGFELFERCGFGDFMADDVVDVAWKTDAEARKQRSWKGLFVHVDRTALKPL